MSLLRHILLYFALMPLCVLAQASVTDTTLTRDNMPTLQHAAARNDSLRPDSCISAQPPKIYWKDAIKQHRFSIKDTSIYYPKFLDFCVRVYRWGDKTFNSYDTTYVRHSGKNWKLMIKSDNWIDTYTGRLSTERMRLTMTSKVASNLGAQIAFMAVSYAYMFDISNMISGKKIKRKRMETSFTCALFSVDFYMRSNSSQTDIHRFGDYKYKNSSWFSIPFNGLSSNDCYGIYGYYYFNNRKYSQAAAYCFSKYQLRSAGTFLIGFGFDRQNYTIDFTELSDNLKQYLPDDRMKYRFNYNDYCIIGGYAYNWVFRKNWLFNVTIAPSIGIRRTKSDASESGKTLFSPNLRAKLALVYNHKRFFYGAHLVSDGHWYKSSINSLYNSNTDIVITAGFRF